MKYTTELFSRIYPFMCHQTFSYQTPFNSVVIDTFFVWATLTFEFVHHSLSRTILSRGYVNQFLCSLIRDAYRTKQNSHSTTAWPMRA